MTIGDLIERIAVKSSHEHSSSASNDARQNDYQLNILNLFGIDINVEIVQPVNTVAILNNASNNYPNIFFVHSIEGVAATLETLGQQIEYPTYCFQCTEDAPLDSIESLAAFYLKVD